MQIKYSDIPQWLEGSEFFRNLNSDEEEEDFIEIPSECYRETNEHVQTSNDLADILRVMRFWMTTEIPQSVLEFCYANDWSVWNSVFDEIGGQEMLELEVVNFACRHSDQFSLSAALSSERPELVIFWMSIGKTCTEGTKHSIAQACRHGRLDLVETLRERGFPFEAAAFCAAAQYGHLYVLHYLHEQGCPYDDRALVFAARGGQIDCMTFLHSIGCKFAAEVTSEFAVAAHYLHYQKHPPTLSVVWTDNFSLVPPAAGYVECLQFALNNGCPVHIFATRTAAEYGLLDCLRLLLQHNAHMDKDVFENAAAGGFRDCLIELHAHKCPGSTEAQYKAALYGHLHCLQYLHTISGSRDFLTASFAATNGHLHCLQWLHENGYAWNHVTTSRAAAGGHHDCLMYLHTNGCSWLKEACESAAEGGHLSCLQYLHENGCPWNKRATAAAALHNHLACLQYMHYNGCEWDEMTAYDAAIHGHIECLKYSLENGCPNTLHSLVKCTAAAQDTLTCLQYLVEERGADQLLNSDTFAAAFTKGNVVNLQYLFEKGCECQSYHYVRQYLDITLSFTDEDFLRCIEMAVEHGWQPNDLLYAFVLERNTTKVPKPAHVLPLCLAYLDARL